MFITTRLKGGGGLKGFLYPWIDSKDWQRRPIIFANHSSGLKRSVRDQQLCRCQYLASEKRKATTILRTINYQTLCNIYCESGKLWCPKHCPGPVPTLRSCKQLDPGNKHLTLEKRKQKNQNPNSAWIHGKGEHKLTAKEWAWRAPSQYLRAKGAGNMSLGYRIEVNW